jgi:hypothetical protein
MFFLVFDVLIFVVVTFSHIFSVASSNSSCSKSEQSKLDACSQAKTTCQGLMDKNSDCVALNQAGKFFFGVPHFAIFISILFC